MRLVALKMVPVFERSKRRQMVRELSALFQMLRRKQTKVMTTTNINTSHMNSIEQNNEFLASSSSQNPGGRHSVSGKQPETEGDSAFANLYMAVSNSIDELDSGSNVTLSSEENTFKYAGRFDNLEGNQAESGITVGHSNHIVEFYDAFANLEDGGVALMMEYLDGGTNMYVFI